MTHICKTGCLVSAPDSRAQLLKMHDGTPVRQHHNQFPTVNFVVLSQRQSFLNALLYPAHLGQRLAILFLGNPDCINLA